MRRETSAPCGEFQVSTRQLEKTLEFARKRAQSKGTDDRERKSPKTDRKGKKGGGYGDDEAYFGDWGDTNDADVSAHVSDDPEYHQALLASFAENGASFGDAMDTTDGHGDDYYSADEHALLSRPSRPSTWTTTSATTSAPPSTSPCPTRSSPSPTR